MVGQWEYVGNLRGKEGVGVPQGGGQGEVLAKTGNVDYATAWTKLRYDQIDGKVPASALPEITTAPFVVSKESEMLNLPAVAGRMAIRTDIGKTFVLAEEPASVLENWIELQTGSAVESVNGKTGNVQLTKADVGLGNVSNTADADKPLATQEVPGLLSPADKKKLDEASSTVPPSTVSPGSTVAWTPPALVMYSGGFGAGAGTFKVSSPYYPENPATKKYADDLVNGRGSSTGRVTATTDLNDLTSPGVYNVTRNSPNLPVVAGFRSDARVEVDVLHTSYFSEAATVAQTVRLASAPSNEAGLNRYAFDDNTAGDLVTSLTFKRTLTGGRWTAWRAEGYTPWFKMAAKSHVGKGFYGIACDTSYPAVREIREGSGLWRISNGMVELQLAIRSDMTPQDDYTAAGDVHPALRMPSGMYHTVHSEATLNQSYNGIIGAAALFNSDTGNLELKLRGPGGGASASSFGFNGLTWPIPIEAYGGN